MLTFGDNLKDARKRHGMNQQALGDAVGVGQTTIANYEKGARFPTGELLKKIGEVLNVSIDQLMDHRVLSDNVDPYAMDQAEFVTSFVELLTAGHEQEAIYRIWQMDPDRDNIIHIYRHYLEPAMVLVGDRWEKGEITVAQEHLASQTVHKILSMLSTIPGQAAKGDKRALCMSLSAEPHTLGIRMVSEFLNLRGITSYYVGSTVPTESLIQMLKEKKVHLLALSATMPYHLDAMKNLVTVLRGDKAFKNLKVLAGGQAFEIATANGGAVDAESLGVDGVHNSFEAMGDWLMANDLT